MFVRLSTFAIACFCGLGASAAEYIAEAPSSENGVPTPTDNLDRMPRDAYSASPSVGVPYHSLFRDTRAPYLNSLRDVRIAPALAPAETISSDAQVDLPDFRGRFPLLQRGFSPENSDLRIGPIYFKLRHISAAVLASDNINQTDNNRKSGSLSIFSIGGQIMAQLSEGFHIAAAGNFVYFPFEGRAGITGFTFRSPYSFGISGAPAAQTQVSWEPTVLGLPIIITDEFKVGLWRFSDTTQDSFDLFDTGNFDATTREGTYSLGSGNNSRSRTGNSQPNRNRGEHIYYSNEVSVATSGTLPGQNLYRFRTSHENIWYQDFSSDRNRLPSARDRVFLDIDSVREDLRFKPFVHYDFYRSDNPQIADHILRTGVKGPITDLLRFRGDVGYILRDTNGSILWRLGLYHTPNPYTTHSLEYLREVADFHNEITQGIQYHITKTLGPDLTGTIFARYHNVEDLNGVASNREELRTGLNLSYLVSPRTRLNFRSQYTDIKYNDGSGTTSAWLTRFDCEHRFFERFKARFIYQFERRNDNHNSNSYYENLAYLSLSWVF